MSSSQISTWAVVDIQVIYMLEFFATLGNKISVHKTFFSTSMRSFCETCTITGKMYCSRYLWHVTHHGHMASATVARGESVGIWTPWQISQCQMKAKIKLRMTLSLHAPSICNKVTNNTFKALQKTKSFDKVCLKFQLPGCAKACSSNSLHCGR